MESAWEEKKIQALFSELKTADERAAPRFATIWNHASIAPRRARVFNFAFVGATALLFCTLVSLTVWSKYSQRTQTANVSVITPVPTSTTPLVATAGGVDQTPTPKPPQGIKRPRAIRAKTQRNALIAANWKAVHDSKIITSWQSPTAALLTSPSDEMFTSLPQLNQSSTQLKSFLPSRSN